MDYMSEQLSGYREKPRLTVTEEEAIRDPRLRRQYRDERIVLIKSGASAWMLRGFDGPSEMGPGVVVDYYAAGGLRGYIEGDDLEGYQVYGHSVEAEEGPHHLNTEPIKLRSEAERTLRDYVSEALLK